MVPPTAIYIGLFVLSSVRSSALPINRGAFTRNHKLRDPPVESSNELAVSDDFNQYSISRLLRFDIITRTVIYSCPLNGLIPAGTFGLF